MAEHQTLERPVRTSPSPGGGPRGWGRRLLAPALVVVACGLALAFGGERAAEAEHFGAASLLPPLVALALVFLTREVISSLLVGILVGGLVGGEWNVVEAYLLPSLGSRSFALILLVYLWALGGMIGIWTRTGGAHHFAARVARRIRSPRAAMLFTWVMGLVFHQGGTISAVLTGTTVRPISDRMKVSHEESSFLVDATASPVASLLPLNVWPIYVAGLVVGTTAFLPDAQAGVSFYFRSIPFNFYAIVMVVVALLFALERLPWEGRRLRTARLRARADGALDRPGSKPLLSEDLARLRVPEGYRSGLADFLVPIGVLLGVAAWGVVPALLAGDLAAIQVPIAEAFGLAVLAAVGVALLKGMELGAAVDGFLDGVKGVTIGAVLLGLAVSLGAVAKSLGTAAYVIDASAHLLPASLLPVLFFAIGMGVAFATGMSFGTYPVTLPIALPLAFAVNPDPGYVSLCFAAVIGGGVFGDQASPLSDTTILGSLSTGADLMDHTLSQLPLALAAAALSALGYFLVALLAF